MLIAIMSYYFPFPSSTALNENNKCYAVCIISTAAFSVTIYELKKNRQFEFIFIMVNIVLWWTTMVSDLYMTLTTHEHLLSDDDINVKLKFLRRIGKNTSQAQFCNV